MTPRSSPVSRFSSRVSAVYSAVGPSSRGIIVRGAVGNQPAEIMLYDEIGPFGITAAAFTKALADAGPGAVKVRINSPGGDVFDGLAIYNALLAHPGGVTTAIDGLAASAASYVAMAGAEVQMAEASFLMIHNAFGLVIGNRNDMRDTAATLDKIDGQMADIYAKRTGQPTEDIAAMMDAETWLTATEAKAGGFADTVLEPPERAQAAVQTEIQAAVVDPCPKENRIRRARLALAYD